MAWNNGIQTAWVATNGIVGSDDCKRRGPALAGRACIEILRPLSISGGYLHITMSSYLDTTQNRGSGLLVGNRVGESRDWRRSPVDRHPAARVREPNSRGARGIAGSIGGPGGPVCVRRGREIRLSFPRIDPRCLTCAQGRRCHDCGNMLSITTCTYAPSSRASRHPGDWPSRTLQSLIISLSCGIHGRRGVRATLALEETQALLKAGWS